MRIACIHIPQFALQCTTRLDPSLRGAPVAVVSSVDPVGQRGAAGIKAAGVLHAPIVLACSRAAWALGVRLGMTATAARSVSTRVGEPTTLAIVAAEPAIERETVRAIADSLLALTPVVDIGGRVGAGGAHLALYAEVPAKMRGSTFGDRLLELLDEHGVTARVGIADDRFTAWVAAAHGGAEDRGVITVPRGGSAAFLSPRPLSLLAIPSEVQHMLEALGVRTLGEFAALPAPSIARPLEADYQALARGESGAQLRPYVPEAPIREDIVVSAGSVLELDGEVGAPAAIAILARRIALRLAGRGRLAARLEVTALPGTVAAAAALTEARTTSAISDAIDVPVSLDEPIAAAEQLARALGPVLDMATEHSRLRVLVSGEALVGATADASKPATIYAEGTAPVYSGAASAHSGNASIYATTAQHVRVADPYAQRGADSGGPIDSGLSPLAVVLSSTGSLFSLSPPNAPERRDAHRRTRRGKQRRTRPATAVQPRLFDRAKTS